MSASAEELIQALVKDDECPIHGMGKFLIYAIDSTSKLTDGDKADCYLAMNIAFINVLCHIIPSDAKEHQAAEILKAALHEIDVAGVTIIPHVIGENSDRNYH